MLFFVRTTGLAIIALLVIAGPAKVAGAVSAGTPGRVAASPLPTPPLEIGHVRSTAYCAMLSKKIAPALLALIKEDQLIAAGHVTFNRMADDTVMGMPHHFNMDLAHLSQVITLGTRDLQTVRKLLSDAAYFPAGPKTDEDRSAVELKTQLEKVADEQDTALNLLSGTHETVLMAQMQEGFPTLYPAPSAVNHGESPPPSPPSADATADPSQYMNDAGLPDRDINAQYSQKSLTAGTSLGRTSYNSLAQVLQIQQNRIAAFEKPASQAVIDAVAMCNASTGPRTEPSPAASLAPK